MKKVYTIMGAALVVLAGLTLTPASWFVFIYQPKVPKSLR